jgi:hypothetical protein
MKWPKFIDHPDPNVVLRSGPIDGGRPLVHSRAPITIEFESTAGSVRLATDGRVI